MPRLLPPTQPNDTKPATFQLPPPPPIDKPKGVAVDSYTAARAKAKQREALKKKQPEAVKPGRIAVLMQQLNDNASQLIHVQQFSDEELDALLAAARSKLTPDMAIFCLEYVKDRNATQAAIRLGKHAASVCKNAAYELLPRPGVREYIALLQKDIARRANIDADWVIKTMYDQLIKHLTEAGEGTLSATGLMLLEKIGKHLGVLHDKLDITTAGGRLEGVAVTFITPDPQPDLKVVSEQ